MMRTLLALVLTVTICSGALAAAPKTIVNPAEFRAYQAALSIANPGARGAALEAFAGRYPKSVARVDALEHAMTAYQVAGQSGNEEHAVILLLQADPQNVNGLAIGTYLTRGDATAGNTQALLALDGWAARGLAALLGSPRPDAPVGAIFYGAQGFAALQRHDVARARTAYLHALALSATGVDAYQLSLADLESAPTDARGFWYAAKSIALMRAEGNPSGAASVETYMRKRYATYHGTADGWDAIVAAAAGQNGPPIGFSVEAAH